MEHGILGVVKTTLYDTVMVDTFHYTFCHKLQNVQRCKLWTLVNINTSMLAYQL